MQREKTPHNANTQEPLNCVYISCAGFLTSLGTAILSSHIKIGNVQFYASIKICTADIFHVNKHPFVTI